MIGSVTFEASGCWNWTGKPSTIGYGQFSWAGYVAPAHRHSYLEFNGPIADNLVVRHKCDNKLCCNPDHLELGTQRDNIRDYLERGNRSYALTDEKVREVMSAFGTTTEVAQQFGLGFGVVSGIKAGRTYNHVTGIPKRTLGGQRPPAHQTFTHNGESHNLRGWALKLGVSRSTLTSRIDRGWSIEKAITTPRRGVGRSTKRP